MRKSNKFLIITIALFLVGTTILSGCSSKKSATENESKGNEKVKLTFETFIYSEAPHKKAIDMLLQKYNEINPNVEIVMQGTDATDFFNKLTIEVVAGTQADIVQLYPENIARYNALVEGGTFINLNDHIKGTDLENKLVGQDLTEIDGSYYAISNYAVGAVGIFYRKSLLQKAGVNPDEIKTLEDFRKAASKLGADTNGDGKLDQWGFASGTSANLVTPVEWYRLVARPISGGIFFPDGEKGPYTKERINVNADANVWAAKWWQDFLNDSNATPPGTRNKKAGREMFWNGATAMIYDGPWFIGMTRERDPKLMDDLGLIPQPIVQYKGTDYKPNPYLESIVSLISKKSKHQKEAWDFLQWMTSPEAQEIIEVSGMIPSNKDFSSSEDYKKRNPLGAKFIEYVDKVYDPALMDPPIPQQGELLSIIKTAAEKMFVGNIDAKTALDEASVKMKEVMSK